MNTKAILTIKMFLGAVVVVVLVGWLFKTGIEFNDPEQYVAEHQDEVQVLDDPIGVVTVFRGWLRAGMILIFPWMWFWYRAGRKRAR